MPLSARRSRRTLDIWPGFVDALASLLLVLVFILLVFVLAQFFLGETLSGRDAALRDLQGRLAALAETLALEQREKDMLNAQLQASLSLRNELETRAEKAEATVRDQAQLVADVAALQALKEELEQQTAALAERSVKAEAGLVEERKISESARAQLALLNQQIAAMRQQLAQLTAALDASEKANADQKAQITSLGQRLNAALATKVQELARYRSEFFGRLREALGDNPDIRIEGDRFVFTSEVLFERGSADLGPEGKAQIAKVAETLKQLIPEIPGNIDWVLQVDGHTDKVPISTPQFPSNWELSQARAMSVLRLLEASGIPPDRLAAAGYAEFKPLEPGDTEAAYRRNRRIELKLTQR